MHTRWGWLVVAGLLASLLAGVFAAGCGAQPVLPTAVSSPESPGEVAGAEGTPAAGEAAPAAATPLPDEESAQPGVLTLKVWMLEDLSTLSDAPGAGTLRDQLAAFEDMQPGVEVDVQAKGVSGRGSAIDYLRTAPPVAPSVLPDVVLLNRSALVEAARSELIVPWETVADETLLAMDEDFYPPAARLGRVDGVLFGLPYMLEVRHAVYRETAFEDAPPITYEDILNDADDAPTFLFPAALTGGVNRTTLLQYLAAGGRLADEEGNPVIDASALGVVLAFYEEARDAGVLDPGVLQLSSTEDTWGRYVAGEGDVAVVSSRPYLAGRAEGGGAALSSIPTAGGEPITLVTGWSWALVTTDPARQAAASALMVWLLEPVNHGVYAQAAGYVPSQPGALAVWGSDDPYVALVSDLMPVAVLPPDPATDSTLGVAMQDAVRDVLLGRASAQEAASAAAAAVPQTEAN